MANQRPKAGKEPIRQSVRVDCPVDDAFRLFTDRFGEWWPLNLYSITGDEAATCVIEPWPGGRVFERTRSGEEHDWGFVIDCDPPKRLRFTWQPAQIDDTSQTVDVEFRADADGTRVTLIHSGWQSKGIAICGLQTNHAEIWLQALTHCFGSFISEQMLVAV